MEGQETRQKDTKSNRKYECCYNKVSDPQISSIMGKYSQKNWVGSNNDYYASERGIEEHVQEVFVVVESNAISYPRAVMVHFQNTLVALRTMMGPIWFCTKATSTHSNSSVLLPLKAHLLNWSFRSKSLIY
jgi:hypothetical protein